jgi:hypothetical protein
VADVKRYVVSLPERVARATAAVAGGAVRETTDLLLPDVLRQSRIYQATVARLLRIVIELVGDVHGVYPPDLMPATELAVRKTAGNVMELAGLAAVGWSPLWLLAAASDILGGTKTYLRALVQSLEEERVLTPGTDIASYEDLLSRLETASGTLADAIDVPPLTLRDARASFDRLRAQGANLPSLDELGALFTALQQTAERERRSLAEVSAVIGIAAARTGIELGNTHIFDYYRQTFDRIGSEGLLVFLQRIVTPYLRRAGAHFRPVEPTYTDRALDWLDRRRAGAAAEPNGTEPAAPTSLSPAEAPPADER